MTARPRPAAEVLEDLIKVTKCALIATPLELAAAIFGDRQLAARAVRRSKAFRRDAAMQRRVNDAGPVEIISTEGKRNEPQMSNQPVAGSPESGGSERTP